MQSCNRDIVECKYRYNEENRFWSGVVIETLWNVNIASEVTFMTFFEL